MGWRIGAFSVEISCWDGEWGCISLNMGQDHFPSSLTKNDAYFCISKVPDIHVLMNLVFFPLGFIIPWPLLFFLLQKVTGKPKSNSKELSVLCNSGIKSCLIWKLPCHWRRVGPDPWMLSSWMSCEQLQEFHRLTDSGMNCSELPSGWVTKTSKYFVKSDNRKCKLKLCIYSCCRCKA